MTVKLLQRYYNLLKNTTHEVGDEIEVDEHTAQQMEAQKIGTVVVISTANKED
jgi:hypothetical protein